MQSRIICFTATFDVFIPGLKHIASSNALQTFSAALTMIVSIFEKKKHNPECCKTPTLDGRICRPIMSFPAVLWRLFCKFSSRSSDPCGQIEPREDDKSDHSRVSQRLRDNPAVCHLNSFGGGRVFAGER